MANVYTTRAADYDLDAITEYTARTYGEKQAMTYTTALKEMASQVAAAPGRCRTYQTGRGVTFLRANSGKHALFMQETSMGILIVRILHQAMDFDRHLD